ncbi:PAS domain S-box protein [Deinococcus yavapaiensis]|uniref:histidine kinase n=1 Tax=Deinococcus yavapaiensis KR-236 TaxID=694435 RepID=A0A318S5W4_9DEIO|nr:PAS domain S-box protein [Deinococcus yavapaiensis]PYE49403.1 PAS domain S-box-containing protein [Deinococcus yavapaiensis KR-236]
MPSERSASSSPPIFAVLDVLFEEARVAHALYDPDLHCLRVNAAFAQLSGWPLEAHAGRALQDVVPTVPPELVRAYRDVLRSGKALRGFQYEVPTASAPSGVRYCRVDAHPVRDERGDVVALLASIEDCSAQVLAAASEAERALEHARLLDEERHARARATMLAEVSDALSASLDVRETLQRIMALAIRQVADWAAVYLPRDDGSLWPVAVGHDDAAKIDLLRWYLTQYPAQATDVGSPPWVMQTGQSFLLPVVPTELVDAIEDVERRDALRQLGMHSVIHVPLVLSGETIGVLGLASTRATHAYGDEDLAFARELASRAALALGNARLHETAIRSEERYRSLVDATRQAVWTNSPEGELLGEQPGWARLTGQTREQYEGYGWLNAVHPDDRQRTRDAWERSVVTRTTFDISHRVRVPDGTYRHFHVRAVPVLQADETVREWVGVHTDITERVAAERALRELNATLEARVEERTYALESANEELQHLNTFNRLLLDSAGEGIFGVDMAGFTTFANPAALRMIGYEHDEVVGRPQHSLVHHSHADGTPYPLSGCPILTSRVDGEVRHVDDEVFWRKDGTFFPVEYVSTPLRSAHGKIVGAVVMFRDVTDRKRAEDELRRANEELRRSNAELERFAFVASHDLQEPLRTIASFTEILNRRYANAFDDTGRKYLALVTRGAERLKVLIDDLLVFSRLNVGRDLTRPVPAERPLREAVTRLAAFLDETGGRVEAGELPTVLGDEGELTQLFQNLVGNAVKFRREGVPPLVRVEARREGDFWHFTVSDNGIGIEKKYFERVFGLFERLHLRDRYEGTGLGLAIVRKIVERHGGVVWLESTVGEGTTVHFTLRDAAAPDVHQAVFTGDH